MVKGRGGACGAASFIPPEPRLLKTGFGDFFPARIFEREPWESMVEINLG